MVKRGKKVAGTSVTLKLRKDAPDLLVHWVNIQGNFTDAVFYLIEEEIKKNGVRDLSKRVLSNRDLPSVEELEADDLAIERLEELLNPQVEEEQPKRRVVKPKARAENTPNEYTVSSLTKSEEDSVVSQKTTEETEKGSEVIHNLANESNNKLGSIGENNTEETDKELEDNEITESSKIHVENEQENKVAEREETQQVDEEDDEVSEEDINAW